MITNAKESHLRKAKGERLQKEVVELILHYFPEYSDNIESAPMSAHGEDIRFDEVLRKVFPVSIEAKYKDKGLSNVYSAYEQAQRQTESIASTIDIKAVAVIKQKNSIPLIVMSADDWIQSFKPTIQNAANTNDEDI
jgi:hypothetical protein